MNDPLRTAAEPTRRAGPDCQIRAVAPGDEDAIGRLLEGLDAGSRYRRWFSAGVDVLGAVKWAAHPELVGAVGLLAVAGDGECVGHGVLVPAADGSGELAFEVAASWRHHGIAGALLERLLDQASSGGLQRVYAVVLPGNAPMLAVLREHGPHSESREATSIVVTLPVTPRAPTV